MSFIADWLLYNALLAFLFLYIDFFMPRETKKGVVLLAIGVYAAALMLVKVIFATYHQLKWMLTEKCCRKLKIEQVRIAQLDNFWKESYKESAAAMEERRKGDTY